MTSLSSQLKRLAVPFASAFAVDADKRRASFLFDPQEAANIDRATFHAIGLNGLEELKQLDSTFKIFEETLFGDESVSFERLVQSETVNEELDRQIASFLLQLSPHFQLKAAWKALEWLVYRYHIHQMNVDDLIMCVFPYHETNVFVRVVQMINVDSPSSIWHWLKPIQKPGVVLSRITVLNHAAADPTFLAYICTAAKKTVKLFLKYENRSNSVLNPMLSFYVSTVAGAIARVDRPSEQLVATLFPYLSRSFKSPVIDYKLSGYMIVSQLVLKVKLKPDIVDELVYKIVKGFDPSTETLQSLLCVISVIFSAQNISGLKAKTWSLFLKIAELSSGLAEMQRTGVSCDNLISTVASAIFRRIFAAKSLIETMEVDEAEEQEDDGRFLLKLSDEFFVSSEMIFDDNLTATLMKNLLNQFCSEFEADHHHAKKALDFFKNVISTISKRHPAAVDKVFSGAYEEHADNEVKLEAVRKFVSFATKIGGDATSCRHDILNEVGTSLFLALNSANSELRRLAVAKLREDSELEHDFVAKSLQERLVDEDSHVVMEAIATLKSKLDQLNPSDFLSALQTILFEKAQIYPKETRNAATSFLLATSWDLVSNEDQSRLFWLAAPFYLLGEDGGEELAKFAPNNPKLKLLSVSGQNSNENRLSKLASTATIDRFSEEQVKNLSRRQLAFAAAVLASKIGSDSKKNMNVANLGPMVAMLNRLTSIPSLVSIATGSEKLAELEKIDLVAVVERILNPFHQDPKEIRIDYPSLLTVKIFKVLFESSSIFDLVFDEETIEKVLFSAEKSENSVKLFWEIVKILLDCCNKTDSAGRPLFRKAFGVMGRSFYTFNPMLMLRFCTIADRFYDKTEANCDYQAFLLQAIEVLLEKSEKMFTLPKSLSTLTPLVDLLTLLANKDQFHSKLAVSCLSRLKDLKFWSGFEVVDHFVDHLLENHAEIASSPQNIQPIISRYFINLRPEMETLPHLGSPKKSPKRKSTRGASSHSESGTLENQIPNDLLALVFQCIIDADLVVEAPWYLVKVVWLLRETDHAIMLPYIAPLIAKLAKVSGNLDSELVSSLAHFYSPSAAEHLNEQALKTFLYILSVNEKVNGTVRKTVLERISKEFFSKLPNEDVQFQIANRILDLHVEDKLVEAGAKLKELFLALPLFKRFLVSLLSELNSAGSDGPQSDKNSPHAGRKRRISRGVSFSDGDNHSTAAKIVFLLECLQAVTASPKKVGKEVADFLISPIFDVFGNTFDGSLLAKDTYTIKMDPQSVLDNEIEYFSCPDLVRQLCLTCLSNIFNNYSIEGATEFRSSGVLGCLESSNLQSQQHALILLEAVSKRKPEIIQSRCSDIFSSICASNILFCDDSYSCRVLAGVTNALIPLLSTEVPPSCNVIDQMPTQCLFKVVDILSRNWSAINNSNGELLFAALFKFCLTKGNSIPVAIAIVLLICRRLSVHKTDSSCDDLMNDIEKSIHFLTSVFNEIDSDFSYADLVHLSEKLCSALKLAEKEARKTTPPLPSAIEIASWIEWRDEGAKNSYALLRTVRLGVLSFVNRLLGVLIEKSRSTQEDDESAYAVCQSLFESVVCLATDDVCRINSNTVNPPSSGSANSSISIPAAYADEVMLSFEQANSLLSDVAFIDAARNILADDDERKECDVTSSSVGEAHWRMQLKTMQVLADRLPEIVSKNKNLGHSIEKLCKLLIKKLKKSSVKMSVRHSICLVLTSLARSATGLIDSSDGGVSTVVECIKNTLEAALSIMKGSANLKVTADNLKLTSLLLECASTCCVSLGASALSSLSNLVTTCLAHLNPNMESFNAAQKFSGISVPSASLNALSQLLVAFSSFTSPFTSDILCRLCFLKPEISKWNVSRVSVELSNRIEEVMTTLSTTHFRLLVPLFPTIYDRLKKESASKDVIVGFLGFVAKSMKKWSRDDLLPHIVTMHSFFVSVLDYRYEVQGKKDISLETIAMVEDEVFHSLIALALKLTESEMRPLFFKIFDWCSRAIEEGRSIRLITFYRLTVRLAESLKSLFHLFAAPIFKQAVEVLQKTNPATAENEKTLLDDPQLDMLLAANVLDMLALLFTNDVSGFTTRNRFDAVESPLVDQLELASEMTESTKTYISHIRDHAAPAIVALAVSVSEDSAWKTVNQSLLTKTQHNLPQVRLAALHVLDLLVTRMSDDYSSALPDTVPYLAPLLEDDDETVESACRDLTQKLDTILGEPISKFM